MTLTRPLIFATGLLAVCSLTAGAGKAGERATEIFRIDSLCSKVDLFAKEHETEAILIGNLASYDDTVPRWMYFESDSLRHEADSGDNLNANAFVYLHEETPVLATFTFQSPSRDWAQYINYYYREDGTLSLAHSRLRSFHGHVLIKRTYWVGESGVLLDSALSMEDLGSGRAFREVREYNDEPVPLYLKVTDLPFKALLDTLTGGSQ